MYYLGILTKTNFKYWTFDKFTLKKRSNAAILVRALFDGRVLSQTAESHKKNILGIVIS